MRVATLWSRFRSLRLWWQVLAWLVLPPLPVALWAASQPRRGRALAWGLAALVTAAWASLAYVATVDPAPRAQAPIARTAAQTTATTATPPADGAGVRPDLVDQLVVAPELPDGGYERGLFVHWIDADGDGCDTRCEVLASERRTDLPGLPGGGWLSAYDGSTTPDPAALDIDHVVALAEGWRSGAAAWDPARRQAFANDLDEPGALVAVTEATNRSKGDRDPASWQPPDRRARCGFATDWVGTKLRWGLTADAAEVAALRSILATCG